MSQIIVLGKRTKNAPYCWICYNKWIKFKQRRMNKAKYLKNHTYVCKKHLNFV